MPFVESLHLHARFHLLKRLLANTRHLLEVVDAVVGAVIDDDFRLGFADAGEVRDFGGARGVDVHDHRVRIVRELPEEHATDHDDDDGNQREGAEVRGA